MCILLLKIREFIPAQMRIAVAYSQILLFRFGVEGQEKEMGMTRKINKSPPLHPPQNVPFFTA